MSNLRMATPSLAILRGLANDDGARRTPEQRMNSVAESLHSGLRPSAQALRDAQDYVDGVRNLEEIIEDVRRRHTRNPDEKS